MRGNVQVVRKEDPKVGKEKDEITIVYDIYDDADWKNYAIVSDTWLNLVFFCEINSIGLQWIFEYLGFFGIFCNKFLGFSKIPSGHIADGHPHN